MRFVDMDGRTNMPNTIRRDAEIAGCYVCGTNTSYYDIKEKVFLCSEECRNERCDIGPSEHIDEALDGDVITRRTVYVE